MTQDEWNASTDPQAMLTFLQTSGRATERKLRLFAVACCRRIWHLLMDERSRKAVEVAETFADGITGNNELALAGKDTAELAAQVEPADGRRAAVNAAYYATDREPLFSASTTITAIQVCVGANTVFHCGPGLGDATDTWDDAQRAESHAQTHLLRCIVNPFRSSPLMSASLLTPEILALAESAYRDRTMPQGTLDPEKLLALADALREADCHDDVALGHLREPGAIHVRGCWVIDLLTRSES